METNKSVLIRNGMAVFIKKKNLEWTAEAKLQRTRSLEISTIRLLLSATHITCSCRATESLLVVVVHRKQNPPSRRS